MKNLGVESLIVTNAAGGVKTLHLNQEINDY